MSDLQFAKSFLTTLDNKTTKYQPHHVFEPKKFQTRIPYTLPKLPHPPHPLPPKSSPSAPPPPGSEPVPSSLTITLLLKSSRNPSFALTLSSLSPVTTTIQTLKEQIQTHLGGSSVVPVEKIKVLVNKKPVPASKRTVSEALDGSKIEDGGTVEFGVMVMGGAPDPPAQAQAINMGTTDTAVAAVTTPALESSKAAAVAAPAEAVDEGRGEPMEGVEKPVQPGEASGKAVLSTPAFWEDLHGFLEQRLKDAEEATRLRAVFESAWRSTQATP